MRTSGFDTARRFFVDTLQVKQFVWVYFAFVTPALTCLLYADFSIAKANQVGEGCDIFISHCKKFHLCSGGWPNNGVSYSSVLVKWDWKS